MSFAELPVELREMICVHCDLFQIKALRLTCHSLRNVADDYLFAEIVTVMTIDSMEAARNVADHPKFRTQPRTLWFQGDRLRQLEFYEWKSKLASHIDFKAQTAKINMKHVEELGEILTEQERQAEVNPELEARRKVLLELIRLTADAQPTPSYSETQLRDHFNHYSSLADEGVQIASDGTIQRCMKAVFEKCTNIRAIDFTIANALRVHTHKENRTFLKGILTPFGDFAQDREGLDAMVAIVLAAADAGFSPHTLRLGCVTFHLVNHPDLFEAMPRFLARVENLNWSLSTPYLDEDCDDFDEAEISNIMEGFMDGHFVEFIKSATNLRCFEIDMPCPIPTEPKADLSEVVGLMSWKHLQVFSVGTIHANSGDLVDFMLRHADTLERLELNEISIDGEWPECFSSFAGKLPRLKEVQLRGIFEDDYEFFCFFGHLYTSRGNEYSQRVARYIVEGGEEFPMPPAGDDENSTLDTGSEDDVESSEASDEA
ncbi:hypothetical protein CBER1_06712 [Cercospora berteroae]|uniref:F-box domain-containing protein n=1 Tax=Cercospora berteroae TaxID=357750 RepID=A0A2S6CND6_9PEZI|nr:hypothetical protein CBER1_06712 [Cercospora berteroae]